MTGILKVFYPDTVNKFETVPGTSSGQVLHFSFVTFPKPSRDLVAQGFGIQVFFFPSTLLPSVHLVLILSIGPA